MTDLQAVAVEPGDTIDFVVDARGRDMHAGFTWAPVLRIETTATPAPEKVEWDAAKDFKTQNSSPASPVFGIWERYAQVLLESNEFMFLD